MISFWSYCLSICVGLNPNCCITSISVGTNCIRFNIWTVNCVSFYPRSSNWGGLYPRCVRLNCWSISVRFNGHPVGVYVINIVTTTTPIVMSFCPVWSINVPSVSYITSYVCVTCIMMWWLVLVIIVPWIHVLIPIVIIIPIRIAPIYV